MINFLVLLWLYGRMCPFSYKQNIITHSRQSWALKIFDFHFYHTGCSVWCWTGKKKVVEKVFCHTTLPLWIFILSVLPLPSCIQPKLDHLGLQAVCMNHEKFWKQMTYIFKILCMYLPSTYEDCMMIGPLLQQFFNIWKKYYYTDLYVHTVIAGLKTLFKSLKWR